MNKMPYPNGTPGYQASIYSAWTLWLVGLVWLAASVGCADEPAHKSEAHPHTQVLTSDQPKQHKDGSSSSAPLSFTRSRIEYRLPGRRIEQLAEDILNHKGEYGELKPDAPDVSVLPSPSVPS